jgi:hypothetical protein
MPNILIGKTLTGMKIAADKGAILFETSDGDIIARCDADCCSHTWVEHIELPALGFPARVTAVDNLDFDANAIRDQEVDGEYHELIQFYGCKISTDRGEIVIDYRNSSNGYYGGWLSWPEERFYGGVFQQNVSKEEWTEVA